MTDQYRWRHSEEVKQRMRLLKIGDRNPMFGRHHSEATIEKMRLWWKKRQDLAIRGDFDR